MLTRVGPEAFEERTLLRPGTVAVGFLADWCGYCARFEPQLERWAKEGFEVVVADVTDEASPLWDRFEVEIVPTVLVFRDGSLSFRADGISGIGLRAETVAAVEDQLRAARR